MIFRAMAVSAVLVIASIGPAASTTCDQRIANLCPGAPITAASTAQPEADASTAAPLKITNGKRATRSAKRHRRSKHVASRHRRGKSVKQASARKRTHTATQSKTKRESAPKETDEMVGLASSEPADQDKPLTNGPALGGGVPAEAVAEAKTAPHAAVGAGSGQSLVNLGPAFAPIGASTLPSRTFMPVASNNATTIVTTKTVNAPATAPVRVASTAGSVPSVAPTRVASADVAPAPASAPAAVAPQKPAPVQMARASTIGGIEITTLRAIFLAFGAVLLAGTAIRLAIG